MTNELRNAFDTWVREDLLYNQSHPSPSEIDAFLRWFERGYNESLAEIRTLKAEVEKMQPAYDMLIETLARPAIPFIRKYEDDDHDYRPVPVNPRNGDKE